MPIRLLFVAAAAGLLAVCGCGTRMASSRESWRANAEVIPPVGAMWLQHPIEGGFDPPVIMLSQGEPVRLLRNHLGFSKIQLSDLRTGWVARGTAFRQ